MVAKRKQRWRDKYALRLGVRPSQRDETSGDVLEVECRFCTSFGREPRPADAVREDGRKIRKRTTNVAKWLVPFRVDNIKTHLVVQHTIKWGLYKDLYRQLNYPDVENGEDTKVAEHQLLTFFGQEQDGVATEMATSALNTELGNQRKKRRREQVEAVEVAAATGAQVAARAAIAAPTEVIVTDIDAQAANGSSIAIMRTGLVEEQVPLLVEEITTADIVDKLVDAFYADDDDFVSAAGKESTMMKRTPDGRTGKFVLSVGNRQELANVQKLLGIGLTFEQVVKCFASSALDTATVRSYARLSLSVALEMISAAMQRAWVYSIAFQVLKCPTNGLCDGVKRNPVLQLRVRLPMSLGTDVADLHVIALPLPSSESSPERVSTFVELVLFTLDVAWRSKILGGCVNGAANDMGAHSSLLEEITRQSTSPSVYRVRRPAHVIEGCLRSALQDLNEGRYQQPTTSGISEKGYFSRELVRLTTLLRGYEPWARVHGRCPLFDAECPWSTLKTLEWALTHRHNLQKMFEDHPYAQMPPSSFWLISSALIDIISGLKGAVSSLESFPLLSRTDSERTVAHSVDEFAKNSKILRIHAAEAMLAHQMCLEGDKFHFGSFCWVRKSALVPYLRSLNLSMRRLYDGLSAGDKHNVEWVIAGFLLTCLDSVTANVGANLLEESTASSSFGSKPVLYDPPPTLPLDFLGINRMDAVDLIECFSERLERAHGLEFLDNISNDIEQLQAIVAANPSLRLELEHAQAKSFRSAWECVPELRSLRTFAAGLATVLPRTVSEPSDTSLNAETKAAVIATLQQRNEDQHRITFGNFATEVHLHMEQAHTVRALHAMLNGERSLM